MQRNIMHNFTHTADARSVGMSNGALFPRQRRVSNEPRSRQRDCGVRRHSINARRIARRRASKPFEKSWSVADRFLTPGAVVRARIEFDEGNDYKVRPAIVVGKCGDEITLIPCTTSSKACLPSDIAIRDLSSAGLTKPTAARTHRTRTIDKRDCLEKLGHLGQVDTMRIQALCDAIGNQLLG